MGNHNSMVNGRCHSMPMGAARSMGGPAWCLLLIYCSMRSTMTADAAAAASRPAKLEWSQPIWHSLEADPGLADYATQYNIGLTNMHRCNTPPEVNGSFVGCGAVFAVVTFL